MVVGLLQNTKHCILIMGEGYCHKIPLLADISVKIIFTLSMLYHGVFLYSSGGMGLLPICEYITHTFYVFLNLGITVYGSVCYIVLL